MSGIWIEGREEPLDLNPHGPGAQLVSIGIDPLPH
jgi:hypothetical protein